MKKLLYAAAFVLAFCGCESKKRPSIPNDGTEVVNATTPPQDTINKTAIPEAYVRTIKGVVKAIHYGKDGYTATVETIDGNYDVTISRSNLSDPAQYREVKPGDKLNVTGDFWQMEDKSQITVRVIE